jgi:hypothetical protein
MIDQGLRTKDAAQPPDYGRGAAADQGRDEV